MSGHQSNLSDPKYGYDMVVATTQEAINLTMKEYLDRAKLKELVICYKWDDKLRKRVPVGYEELKQATGVDPFAIPNGSDENESLKKLDDYGFQFAFRTKPGIPEKMDPLQVPPVVTLDRKGDSVTYRLFFAEFNIVELAVHHRQIIWKNLTQPADNPWILKFTVMLGREADAGAFAKLKPETQERLKKLNPDTAFSVEQLYIDLNNRQQQELPVIEGLEKGSDAYLALEQDYINTYWDQLKGRVLLGQTVMPKAVKSAAPSLVPTAMDIEVSPYLDSGGQPMPSERELYTLNYLVMSDNRRLPAPVPFGWNWIDEKEHTRYHGVMAVRRERFVDFLNRVLSPALKKVCFDPWTQVTLRAAGFKGVEYLWGLPEIKQAPSYTPVTESSSRVLTFEHKGGPAVDNAGINGSSGWMSLDANTTSDVHLEGNLIKVVTTVRSHVTANYWSSNTFDSQWIDTQITRWFQMSVDSRGEIVVTLSKDTPAIVDKSETKDLSVWGKIVAADIEAWRSSLAGTQSSLKGHLEDYEGNLAAMLKDAGAWVFPGGKTFLYNDVYCSDARDLVTHITYADPA